jgi:HSP20 family protein
MSLVKGSNVFPTVNNFFDDFFTRDFKNWGLNNYSTSNSTIPAVNIRETDANFEVELAAPGMSKDDFKIELDGNHLTISCQKQSSNEQEKTGQYTKQEFSYQSFYRTLLLPKDVVDADKIGARYENGLLFLSIPKREEAKQRPPRTIPIS